MKTQLSILTLAAATALTLNACHKDGGWPCIRANGDIVKETRHVENFDRLEMDLSGNVYLTQDSSLTTPLVEIETSENVIDRIETEIKHNTLVIKDKRCINHLRTMNVYVKVPDIEAVYLNGSGNISSKNTFRLSSLETSINGSGNIRFSVVADEVKADINGSGDIHLDGSATEFNVSISGSGNVKAYDLDSYDCYVDINGSGDCEVTVSHLLHVEISGSGDVHYDGTPTDFYVNNQGSGNVSHR